MSAAPPPVQQGYPETLREEVDHYLEALSFTFDPALAGLQEAMRYSLLAGGKRIRPVLALATGRALGGDYRELLPLAGALELIHTYSLIHDDLPAMDNDDLRRGQATCHRVYGEDVAILAGDALYAEAFRHLLAAQPGEPKRVLAAAAELAQATGVNGMVGGQFLDVQGQVLETDGLRKVHALKTGRLIKAAVICPVLLAGAGERVRITLDRFAAELGVLFQIVDDILDVTGTDQALGKPRGSDERAGRTTYVSTFGLARTRELARASYRAAQRALGEAAAALAAEGRGAPSELEKITDFIYRRTS